MTDADCPRIQPLRIKRATCGDAHKVLLLARSDDGGSSFAAQMKYGLPAATNRSELKIVGIDAADPDIVYAKLVEAGGETLYVSKDAAVTWTKILDEPDAIAFVARKSGEIVAGTKLSGSRRSLDHGTTWTDLANAPHIGCLTEDAAGLVWACTQNYAQAMMMGMPAIPADGFGMMTTTDLATWTGVMRYQDIADPVSCPSGTAQHDQCVEKDDGHAVGVVLPRDAAGHHQPRRGLLRSARVYRGPGRGPASDARCDQGPTAAGWRLLRCRCDGLVVAGAPPRRAAPSATTTVIGSIVMRRIALAGLLIAALAPGAFANGRAPGTSDDPLPPGARAGHRRRHDVRPPPVARRRHDVALDVRERRRLRRPVGPGLLVSAERHAVRDDVRRSQVDERRLHVRLDVVRQPVRVDR